MSAKRKIVFVKVEGISDQTALAAILSKVIKTEEVIVEFTNGDITTEKYTTPQNIVAKIGDIVKKYSLPYSYKATDYLEVIHIVDTDGAFIGDDRVLNDSSKRVYYESDYIKTENCDKIILRNHQKAANIRRLISLSKVWNKTIPYSIYFFSCNLDHVLHNDANIHWEEKQNRAAAFAKFYRRCPENFLEFIQNDKFAIKTSFSESWSYIEIDENSLKRYTNPNILFSVEAKNIKRTLIKV